MLVSFLSPILEDVIVSVDYLVHLFCIFLVPQVVMSYFIDHKKKVILETESHAWELLYRFYFAPAPEKRGYLAAVGRLIIFSPCFLRYLCCQHLIAFLGFLR